MADEWSKPVKGKEGADFGWTSTAFGGNADATVNEFDVSVCDRFECHSAPRDVVLRLLAAEASDRLGWVWEVAVDILTGRLAASHDGWTPTWEVNFEGNGVMASLTDPGLPDSPDELLAAIHGRFLLEESMREGA
jgi:hypothetical protein